MYKPKRPLALLRFSDYFGLSKTQAQLDFVDVPLQTDIHLFLDPYALHVGRAPWFIEANNLVVDFFNHLLEAIRSGDELSAVRLLQNMREPNDARLGLCTGEPDGRGIGVKQAHELYLRFKNSRAVQTGSLKDLLDCELMIPGISSDKISDMTVNIVRHLLVTYTQAQCELWGIPTDYVEAGIGWDGEMHVWVNEYANLPVYKGKRIILIPKAAVRRRLECNHEDYFNKEVIPFLQAEELNANTGLVRMLKNGGRKVYKKDIEQKYFNAVGLNIKDQLQDFTQKHPDILVKYKMEKSETSQPLSDYDIEETQQMARELFVCNTDNDLTRIRVGTSDANTYHEVCIGSLTTIFGDWLINPKKEQKIHDGRKRIDITYNNGAASGFFYDLITKYGIKCPYVFVECKNYAADPANPELDQLTGRFSLERGQFGILVCRTVADENLLIKRCKDIMHDKRGYVLFLTDNDLVTLARFKASENISAIQNFMQQKMDKLIL